MTQPYPQCSYVQPGQRIGLLGPPRITMETSGHPIYGHIRCRRTEPELDHWWIIDLADGHTIAAACVYLERID